MDDAFLSYATEDEPFPTELAGALKSRGFKIWYAPLSLRVGDNLLDSINAGLQGSRTAILLVSTGYLGRPWPKYELDVLLRSHFEGGKKILQIWHGVTKEDAETVRPGLTGVFALNSQMGLPRLTDSLTEVLAEGLQTRAVVRVALPSVPSGSRRGAFSRSHWPCHHALGATLASARYRLPCGYRGPRVSQG